MRRMVLPVYLFVVFSFSLLFLLADHVLTLSSASGECPRFFDSGNLGRLLFPLTTPKHKHCGMLPIHGCEDEDPNTEKTVYFGKKMFQVIRLGGSFNTLVSVRDGDSEIRLEKDDCNALCCNITLPPTSPLGSFHIQTQTMTSYKCNIRLKVSPPKQFFNYTGCGKSHNQTIYFRTQDQDDPPSSLAACPRVQLPVNTMAFSADPFTLIASELSINIQVSQDCLTCLFMDKRSCRLNNTGGFYCSKFSKNL